MMRIDVTNISHLHGQALTEFLLWSISLLPLLLALPLLGKFAEMNQTAIQASRYVAWERTVMTTEANWKTDSKIEGEIRSRLFANIGRPIKSDDVVSDVNVSDHNGFLQNYGENSLITSFNDIAAKTSQSELTLGSKAKVLATFNTLYFQLPTANLWRGEVIVTMPKISLLSALPLKITRYNAILADPWDAGTSENEIARMKKSTGMTNSPLTKAWPLDNASNTLMNSVEPAFKDFELGRLGPHPLPVPKDRL